MKKRILIPTDFSANAFNAVRYAMELYKEVACEFFILHTYYLSGYSKENLLTPKPSDEDRREIETKAAENMENLMRRMDSYLENPLHSFRYMTEFGPYFDIMVNTAEREDIDIVIMGTLGQTDNKTVIVGSNAVNVMEKVRYCPVMAIPSTVVFQKPNEIVFPTNFNTFVQKDLRVLAEIANLTQAPIRILHVQKDKTLTEEQEKNKTMLESILNPVPYTHHTLYDMDLRDGVRSFVQSRESEMIAFVNRKHTFFGSIFSNPLVKELGNYANVPLLAMHDGKN